jgi:GET complex subunit GET2
MLYWSFYLLVIYNPADPPPPYSSPRGDLTSFIGEDPPPPLVSDRPSRHGPNPRMPPLDTAGRLGSSRPDPSAWSNEQQQQFLQALLGGPMPSEPRPLNDNAPVTNSAVPDDPLIALMSSMGVEAGIGQSPGVSRAEEAKPKTFIQKLLPILHVIAVWALVAFFICWREPEAFRARNSAVISTGDIWNRWARLASGPAEQSTWGIEVVVSLPLVAAAQLSLA